MGMQTFYGTVSTLLLWSEWWHARGNVSQWYTYRPKPP